MNITWTEDEKMQLLEALQKFGVNDLEAIAANIPTKTVAEIEYAMKLYERQSIVALKSKGLPKNRDVALDKWLSFIKEISSDAYKSEDLVTAIKFIALSNTKDKNLRAAYGYIANLLMGDPPKPINDETMNFIMAAFKKLALHVKDNMKEESDFINSLTLDDILQKTYKSKKILNDPIFNPLKIPANLLNMKEDALN